MDHVFSVSKSRAFEGFDPENDAEPPILVSPNNTPLGSGQGSSLSTPLGNTVDVVRNFYWTYSKLGDARQEVPKIYLKELRLKTNALISQLKYSYGVTKETVQALVGEFPDAFKNQMTSFIGNTIEQGEDYLQKLLPQTVDTNPVYNKNPQLNPYKNLYITDPTGWEFVMPYFENYNNMQSNTFSQDANNPFVGLISQAAAGVTDIASAMSMLRSPTQISFVEKSKFYNYSEEGEEFTFMFPLINTGSVTFEDVVRNWELIFLLLYNNKPSRKNKSLIEPPVLYQVEIPGVKFLPFCYVSQMAVDFQGSRRELSFDLPYIENLNLDAAPPTRLPPGSSIFNNLLNRAFNSVPQVRGFVNTSTPRRINAIIPDAYVIKITLKSLIAESKNFMYSILNQGSLVSTRTIGDQAQEIVRNIIPGI